MHAAYYTEPGPPEVIRYGELPTPEPQAGEVLVKVVAAALNPVDTYVRAGTVAMPGPNPKIPGCDLAGTVAAVGPGAGRFRVGDRVWGTNQGLMGRQGTFAEYAAVHEDWLYPTPAGVADADAAAAALVGVTAHLGLFRCAGLKSGETVYVSGGTGGVGLMVVQMARAAGARVATTVGSAEKAKLARDHGAELTLNYKTDDVPAGLKAFTGGAGLNVWYETQREVDFDTLVPLIAFRGRVVIMAGRAARPVFPVGPFYTNDLSLHGFIMFKAAAAELRACAEDMNRWLADGRLKAVIGRTFPLREAAAAHRFQEENTLHKAGTLVGKVVVDCRG